MARPRKDGLPSAQPTRIGKARPTPKGGTYRVRAYGSTPTNPYGRVSYRNPETDRPTSAVPGDGQSLDELFEQIERALDQQVAISATTSKGDGEVSARDIRALGDLYLADLRRRNLDKDYIGNRKNMIKKWIVPSIGHVLVRDWDTTHSEKVMEAMRGTTHNSPATIEFLGTTLSGMRKSAWRKRSGGRWLSRDDDPMEDVSYARKAVTQGADSKFIPEHKRPSTGRVETAIQAARQDEWSWMSHIISIAAFCAPRLSEQLALRAIDIDFTARVLDLNGTWALESDEANPGARRHRHRHVTLKNKLRRVAPYRGSQHDMLLGLVRDAFGVAVDTPEDDVVAMITDERARRADLTSNGDWRDYIADIHEELWLFKGHDGLPPSNETFNEHWLKVRDASEWSRFIPYRNMRHHAALWWRKQGFDWDEIADWDGHDVPTLLKFYTRASEDSTMAARSTLDRL